MIDIFKDILPSILQTKKKLDCEKEYVPFVINRALSFHYDCILQANQLNMMHWLDKNLQYDYIINSTRAYKRPFRPWLKKETIENLDLIREYYNCSPEKSKEILALLSTPQFEELIKRLFKGGINDKHKRSGGGKTQ